MKRALVIGAIATTLALGYEYSDQFDTLNQDYWYVFAHGGHYIDYTPPAYEKVTINDGVLQMVVNETDNGPELMMKNAIEITPNSVIDASWRIKVHYANEYFAGSVNFWMMNRADLLDPHTQNYDIPPYKYYNEETGETQYFPQLATVYYRNYVYNNYPAPYGGNAFGMCEIGVSVYDGCIVTDPIWDEWFTTRVRIDLPNQTATMWINDQVVGEQEFNLSALDLATFKYLRIQFSPYGWWTGHEMDLDWFTISVTEGEEVQSSSESSSSVSSETSSSEATSSSSSSVPAVVQHFYVGWNLVGGSVNGDDLYALFNDKPVLYIWAWDNSAKMWGFWSKDDQLIERAFDFGAHYWDYVPYLEGYWVYATEEFDLYR